MLHWRTDRPGWLEPALARPSPNFDARPAATEITLLVIHYISLPPGRFSGDAIERLFTNRLSATADPSFVQLQGVRVSSHFLIRRRGELLQFVGCDDRAWHAGDSLFQGRRRCNDFSIGIELEGDGDHAFTQAQYRRLQRLVAPLSQRYPLRFVAGHSDIAPGRKDDPGPRFDWNYFVKSIAFAGLVRPFSTTSRARQSAAR